MFIHIRKTVFYKNTFIDTCLLHFSEVNRLLPLHMQKMHKFNLKGHAGNLDKKGEKNKSF